MPNHTPAPTPPPALLTLPKEIRLLIYTHLFTHPSSTIKVEPALPNDLQFDVDTTPSSDSDTFRMPAHAHPLSSQLLLTSRHLHAEAAPVLYATNAFDCTARDALRLLLNTITPRNFAHITALILDWDQLLDFSFQLAKPSFVALTANLSDLSMAHWRTRVLGGSSFLWWDVKASERTLVQSALAIVEKAARLKVVVQRHWVPRSGRGRDDQVVLQGSAGGGGVAGLGQGQVRRSSSVTRARELGLGRGSGSGKTERSRDTLRIKWRFLASESQMWPEEARVDLEGDLKLLTAKGKDEVEGSVQSALDPF